MKRIAIFASGTGTNALKILEYFNERDDIVISCILSNNNTAGVLNIAHSFGIETKTFNRSTFYHSEQIINYLRSVNIDLIVLAGFLWLIPHNILKAYTSKILNIHPALLPDFGGKGMYGMHVHEAVKASKRTKTGITIHQVDEHYDNGDIIFQAECNVDPDDSPLDIAHKIQILEHKHYPEVIDRYLQKST